MPPSERTWGVRPWLQLEAAGRPGGGPKLVDQAEIDVSQGDGGSVHEREVALRSTKRTLVVCGTGFAPSHGFGHGAGLGFHL